MGEKNPDLLGVLVSTVEAFELHFHLAVREIHVKEIDANFPLKLFPAVCWSESCDVYTVVQLSSSFVPVLANWDRALSGLCLLVNAQQLTPHLQPY